MKQNSLKILAWAYSKENRWVNRDEFEYLLNNMSRDGIKSSLFLLEKSNHLLSETINDNKMYMITSHGRSLLEVKFPALISFGEERDWQALIFLSAPDKDPSFRYLRKALSNTHAFALTRGVFMHLGAFPASIMDLCKDKYLGSLAILTVNDLIFGDERLIIGQRSGFNDEASVLSGLSKEINELIGKYSGEKVLLDRQKMHIFSIFNRLYDSLARSSGVMDRYFPQVESYFSLLKRLQKFSVSVFSA
jgi:hypothetical protein